MKRAMLLLATTLVLTACATSAPDTSAADEEKLRNDAGVWFDHYNQGNADAVANLYAEDGVIMAPGAPSANGRAAIRAYIANDIQQAKASGISLRSGEVTGVGVSGDMAWLTGTFAATDASGTMLEPGKYLSVYKKVDGNWLLIRDIWNSDRAPAAPVAADTAPAATTTAQ